MPSPASGQKTRQALLDAAKVFLGEGNRDVSIQEIASAAGVAVGSVYTYFKDKNELFEIAAQDALLTDTPVLQQIVEAWDDPALGLLASVLYASKRPNFAPQTSRIILTVGPLGFANFGDYFEGPKNALRASIAMGKAKCDDVDAFSIAISGAYQNLLANVYAKTTDPEMPERVMWLFTRQLGYSRQEFDSVVKFVDDYTAKLTS